MAQAHSWAAVLIPAAENAKLRVWAGCGSMWWSWSTRAMVGKLSTTHPHRSGTVTSLRVSCEKAAQVVCLCLWIARDCEKLVIWSSS